jgi:hypothetical protein
MITLLKPSVCSCVCVRVCRRREGGGAGGGGGYLDVFYTLVPWGKVFIARPRRRRPMCVCVCVHTHTHTHTHTRRSSDATRASRSRARTRRHGLDTILLDRRGTRLRPQRCVLTTDKNRGKEKNKRKGRRASALLAARPSVRAEKKKGGVVAWAVTWSKALA